MPKCALFLLHLGVLPFFCVRVCLGRGYIFARPKNKRARRSAVFLRELHRPFPAPPPLPFNLSCRCIFCIPQHVLGADSPLVIPAFMFPHFILLFISPHFFFFTSLFSPASFPEWRRGFSPGRVLELCTAAAPKRSVLQRIFFWKAAAPKAEHKNRGEHLEHNTTEYCTRSCQFIFSFYKCQLKCAFWTCWLAKC